MKKIYIILLLMFIILTSISFPQVPRIINYQGLLVGPEGQIFPEGQYDLTFSLYNEPGDLLWTETHQQVFITGGMFQVHLGSVLPLELPFEQGYFLGIRVNSDPEMEPRMPLTSAAYSLKSANSESLEGFRLSEVPIPYHILPLDSTGMFPKSVIPPDSGGSGGGGIGGSGTANYIPRFNSEFNLGNSVLYQHNGNIGIGTTTPTYKFELAGFDAKIYGLTIGRGGGGIGTNTAFGYQSLNSNISGSFNTAIGLNSLQNNTLGNHNTAIGGGSLISTNGFENTGVGYGTLYTNVGGSRNTAIGYRAMFFANDNNDAILTNNTAVGYSALEGSVNPSNNTGINNVAIGVESLFSNTSGQSNTAIGTGSLYSNTFGFDNTAIGYYSLNSNISGGSNSANGMYTLYLNTTGNGNVANGYSALFSNTEGEFNTANGFAALYRNTSGDYNTANGWSALYSNIDGYDNTSIGIYSMYSNVSGWYNTAIGSAALQSNTYGQRNTAVGRAALNTNTQGYNNTAVGSGSLQELPSGNNNTAVGYYSGGGNYSYSNCTYVGSYTNPNSTGYDNSTGLGYYAATTSSNQVRIGNSSVTSIGGYAGWTNLSDERYKIEVQENVEGLDFIMKLRPVTYRLDMNKLASVLKEDQIKNEKGDMVNSPNEMDVKSRNEKSQIVYTGFIAQEVEKVAREIGYNFSGVDAPKNDDDFYGLRYAEFVVPLVKAVQEQQQIIEELKKRIEALERK